jgi:glycosyltransferase involved in cell wall biosynthesis
MKVLHVIDHLGPGGAQRMLKAILEKPAPNKELYLYTLRKSRNSIGIRHANIIVTNSNSKLSPFAIFQIARFIKANRIDILHCHLLRSQVYGWFIKKFFCNSLKLVLHEHGGIFRAKYIEAANTNKSERAFRKWFLNTASNDIDLVLAVSQATKRAFLDLANVSQEKIHVLHNCYDETYFCRNKITVDRNKARTDLGIKENGFVVGFAGRLIEMKGWRVLLGAAKRLSHIESLNFFIVGDGDDAYRLKQILQRSDLKNVSYLGYVEDMLNDFYALIDCVVMPSLFEACGLVEFEAQALGVPVIASNVQGLNEIVQHDFNGLLFRSGDSRELADHIEKIFHDSDLRNRIITQASISLKQFERPRYIDRLDECYRRLEAL